MLKFIRVLSTKESIEQLVAVAAGEEACGAARASLNPRRAFRVPEGGKGRKAASYVHMEK